MEIHFKIAGCILISLAAIHIVFPRYFNWGSEFKLLSLINRQMMMVHTFFIALTLMLMGILCLTSYKELIETELGNKISMGFGVFWIARLLIQLFGYSPALWRGKRFETIMHVVFTLLWIYLSSVFLSAYFC